MQTDWTLTDIDRHQHHLHFTKEHGIVAAYNQHQCQVVKNRQRRADYFVMHKLVNKMNYVKKKMEMFLLKSTKKQMQKNLIIRIKILLMIKLINKLIILQKWI